MSATATEPGTVSAITGELTTLAAERREAQRRFEQAKIDRRAAVLDRHAPREQITDADAEIRESELVLERLDLLQPQLMQRLAAAHIEQQRAKVDDLLSTALSTLEAYRAALATYPRLAEEIVKICRLDEAAARAIRAAQQAAAANGEILQFDTTSLGGGFLAKTVVLPGQRGAMLWGSPPALQPTIIY